MDLSLLHRDYYTTFSLYSSSKIFSEWMNCYIKLCSPEKKSVEHCANAAMTTFLTRDIFIHFSFIRNGLLNIE